MSFPKDLKSSFLLISVEDYHDCPGMLSAKACVWPRPGNDGLAQDRFGGRLRKRELQEMLCGTPLMTWSVGMAGSVRHLTSCEPC
ncbi:unnamed protein product [Musa acuminata subsp. burmannicoides]